MQLLFQHIYRSLILKKSLINPLMKTMTPLTISDTRPFNQLLEFLETYELLDARQACYRRSHITETALIAVTNDIRYAREKSKVSILILFDFWKAFDSIPFKRLLQKLRITFYLSKPTLTWFYFNYISSSIKQL